LQWASWPVPDTFPLHTDFHVKFHIVHVDLQSGHVDFAEWWFWHLPKLHLVDSNRSLDQCWPVIEKRSGYQPGSKSRYHITYLLVPFPRNAQLILPTWPGIRILDIM
jgi:hypothetical protein